MGLKENLEMELDISKKPQGQNFIDSNSAGDVFIGHVSQEKVDQEKELKELQNIVNSDLTTNKKIEAIKNSSIDQSKKNDLYEQIVGEETTEDFVNTVISIRKMLVTKLKDNKTVKEIRDFLSKLLTPLNFKNSTIASEAERLININ